MDDDLAREMRDRTEIDDLLARYCEAVDAYDMDGVAACFTDDARTDYGPGRGGPVDGRPAIRARIARGQAEFRRTYHQLGQRRVQLGDVDPLDGRTARASTYVFAWHERWDGRRDEAYLRYDDELRHTPAGWRIAVRRVRVDGVVGFPGVAWDWVSRRPPENGPAAG